MQTRLFFCLHMALVPAEKSGPSHDLYWHVLPQFQARGKLFSRVFQVIHVFVCLHYDFAVVQPHHQLVIPGIPIVDLPLASLNRCYCWIEKSVVMQISKIEILIYNTDTVNTTRKQSCRTSWFECSQMKWRYTTASWISLLSSMCQFPFSWVQIWNSVTNLSGVLQDLYHASEGQILPFVVHAGVKLTLWCPVFLAAVVGSNQTQNSAGQSEKRAGFSVFTDKIPDILFSNSNPDTDSKVRKCHRYTATLFKKYRYFYSYFYIVTPNCNLQHAQTAFTFRLFMPVTQW